VNLIAPSSPGVVLLHGLARTSRSLRKMERALQDAGFATLNLDYASRRRPIEALVEDIHPAISGFAESAGSLHFVTHSMGAFWRAPTSPDIAQTGCAASSCSDPRTMAARSRTS
jgi:hypothetical protein